MQVDAKLTWNPLGSCEPEVLQVRLPSNRITEFGELIGTEAWKTSEAVVWIATRQKDGSYVDKIYRLARITSVEQAGMV